MDVVVVRVSVVLMSHRVLVHWSIGLGGCVVRRRDAVTGLTAVVAVPVINSTIWVLVCSHKHSGRQDRIRRRDKDRVIKLVHWEESLLIIKGTVSDPLQLHFLSDVVTFSLHPESYQWISMKKREKKSQNSSFLGLSQACEKVSQSLHWVEWNEWMAVCLLCMLCIHSRSSKSTDRSRDGERKQLEAIKTAH